MTVTVRKYNPGFLSDEELVGSFCVRLDLFESMVECLRECTGSANTHQIVIGPRGSGKTSLLLRVAAEIRRVDSLSSRFFPIVFAEESYQVSSPGEFWLECLSRLADQVPHRPNEPDLQRSYEELRCVPDDQMLGDRCLGILQDFAGREDKRLVLIVENLNMMFGDFVDSDVGWRLRQTLQTEPRIILLASATTRFDEIDNPDCAFYDLFRELTLRPLELDECEVLWKTISGRDCPSETMKALRILTGGSPRLLTIIAGFGANLSFRDLMTDLLDLVDDHTEYFKSHLDVLPAQERRVYLALADLWIPATAREIAERARSDTSKCSAQLARLVERGAVEVVGGSARRKQYYISERLYNIYYLMRRSRGTAPLVEALIQFMEAYYSPLDLKGFANRAVCEIESLDGEANQIHQLALGRLLKSPFLPVYPEELNTLVSSIYRLAPNDTDAAKVYFDRALAVADAGNESDAIALWDNVIQRLNGSNVEEDLEIVAAALNYKGKALETLNQTDQAIAVWDEMIRRFGASKSPKLISATANVLIKKVIVFSTQGRPEELLTVCDEIVERFGASDSPTEFPIVAWALAYKGTALVALKRFEESLAVSDETIERLGSSDSNAVFRIVSMALNSKGAALAGLNRLEEALEVFDLMLSRDCDDSTLEMTVLIAGSLFFKGAMLAELNRTEMALTIWEDVVRRFGMNDQPRVQSVVKETQLMIAELHLVAGRYDASISAVDCLFDLEGTVSPVINCQGHLTRGRAQLLEGNETACVPDIETGLLILSELDSVSTMVIDSLCRLSVEMEPELLRELIITSPVSDLLLPLTTALERELGLETRVAREVEEVAADIQRKLEKLRDRRRRRGD